MRKVYIVFASIFGGLALLLTVIGMAHVLAPDPLNLGAGSRSDYGDEISRTEAMLPYLAGCVSGVGVICAGIVSAVISHAFVNLLIGFRRAPKVSPNN